MSKEDRFNAVIDHLMSIGRVHKQKDIASALACTETTVSQARKGVERALTDNFLMRFLIAYPDIFSTRWLMTGEGQMLLNDSQPKQSARAYTLPDQSPEMAAESAPLTDRDLLAATYTSLSRLSDSFRAYQLRTEAKLRVMESLLTHLDPTYTPTSLPDVSPSEQDTPTVNQQKLQENQ